VLVICPHRCCVIPVLLDTSTSGIVMEATEPSTIDSGLGSDASRNVEPWPCTDTGCSATVRPL
jgi:hypothetical protein